MTGMPQNAAPAAPPQASAQLGQQTPGYDLSKGPWFGGRFARENMPPTNQQVAVELPGQQPKPLNGVGGIDRVQKMAVFAKACALALPGNAGVQGNDTVGDETGKNVRVIDSRSAQGLYANKQQRRETTKALSLEGFGKSAARLVASMARGEGYDGNGKVQCVTVPRAHTKKSSLGAGPSQTAVAQHPQFTEEPQQQMQALQSAQQQMQAVAQPSMGAAPQPQPTPQMGAASGNPILQPRPIGGHNKAMMGSGPLTNGNHGLYGMRQNPMAGGKAPVSAGNQGGDVKIGSVIGNKAITDAATQAATTPKPSLLAALLGRVGGTATLGAGAGAAAGLGSAAWHNATKGEDEERASYLGRAAGGAVGGAVGGGAAGYLLPAVGGQTKLSQINWGERLATLRERRGEDPKTGEPRDPEIVEKEAGEVSGICKTCGAGALDDGATICADCEGAAIAKQASVEPLRPLNADPDFIAANLPWYRQERAKQAHRTQFTPAQRQAFAKRVGLGHIDRS